MFVMARESAFNMSTTDVRGYFSDKYIEGC